MNKKFVLIKLKKYSVFSAIFILLKNDSTAEVVYTDIDPDYVFDVSPFGIWLDIDDNGSSDIGLQNYSFTTYSFSIQETYTFQFLLAFRYHSQNAFAGYENSDGTCFPYALAEGEVLNTDQNWQVAQTQFLATNRFHSGFPYHNCTDCNWYNDLIPETIDHYLGIRFVDEEGDTHYGWIRCDVLEDGSNLIVKDYAYETQVNYPIIAGDTSHFVGNENYYKPLEAVVYALNKQLFINISNPSKVHLFVWDITGNEILEKSITSQYEVIPLNIYSTGTYFIELKSEERVYRTKIVI